MENQNGLDKVEPNQNNPKIKQTKRIYLPSSLKSIPLEQFVIK